MCVMVCDGCGCVGVMGVCDRCVMGVCDGCVGVMGVCV